MRILVNQGNYRKSQPRRMHSNSTYLPEAPLVAALAILLGLISAPAGAQNFTYKQKQQCTDVAAQDARQVGSAGTPDPATARAMKAVGLMNGPSWLYGVGTFPT